MNVVLMKIAHKNPAWCQNGLSMCLNYPSLDISYICSDLVSVSALDS